MSKWFCTLLQLFLYGGIVYSQSQIIFYDPLDNCNITLHWSAYGDVNCETQGPCTNPPCSELKSDASIESRLLSTSGYEDIQLRFRLKGHKLTAGQFCDIYYSVANITSWTLLTRWDENDWTSDTPYDLPSSANDNPNIKIKFYLNPELYDKHITSCFVDDVYLIGNHQTIGTTQFITTQFILLPYITAIFSDNYLKILISIRFGVDNVMMISSIDGVYTCDDIFVDSVSLLGDDAVCVWNNEYEIEIQLSSNSVIDINDVLVLDWNAFYYIYFDIVYNLENDSVLTVSAAMNPTKPWIMIDNLESNIGICDGLILNAAFTQYLGGRNAIFEWQFISSTPNNSNLYLMSIGSIYGEIVMIDANNIDINSMLSIQLSVTTWYGVTETSEIYNIYKSQHSIPHISLSGPTTYTITNDNYKHDYVHINSITSYNTECMNASSLSSSFPYSFVWSISSTTLQTAALQDIQSIINTVNTDHIAIDTTLIYPGNDYIFRVDLICDCNGSNTSSSLRLYYEYSDIECSVHSVDTIYLDSLTQEQFIEDYVLFLDGYTMTYDPNAISVMSKSHLHWDWQCIVPEVNVSCNDLFDSSLLSTEFSKYITFSNYQSDNIYNKYRFIMSVSDLSNINRDYCTSYLDLVIDLKESSNIVMKYLSVSISVASLLINSDDRLRISVLMINDEITDNEYYQYEWIESNDLLSNKDLNEMNMNQGSNGNLILESNVLQRDFVYSFQVNVTKWFLNEMIGNGLSPTIDITVLNGPFIGPLTIYPHCNKTYSSLSQLLSVKHYISVSADSDYVPLFYKFVYYFDDDPTQYEYSMHQSLLFKPYLFDVVLPFGSFKLKTLVYDSKSSSNWKEIQCNIMIDEEDECISFHEEKNDRMILNDMLQSMTIYLNYMNQYYDDNTYNTECLQSNLLQFIHVFYDGETLDYNFCETDWSLLLAQIFTQYFSTLIRFDLVYEYIEYIDTIYSVLLLILDPCNVITHTITDVDLLFLSPQSIIDGNAIIYYGTQENAIDITNGINQNILSDIQNGYILYELSSSLISIMDVFNEYHITYIDHMVDLLSKSLYIHALYSISTSIPGESVQSESDGFEIYSSRVATDGDVNVSLHHIQIAIDNDVFEKGRGSFCDLTPSQCVYDSVDVIVIAKNNPNSNNNNAIIQEQDKCVDDADIMNNYNGTISNDSISIVIIGGNLTESTSNTSIIFNHEQMALYDTFECVWFDESTEIWRNTGCSTVINGQLNTIECICDHLTTFSIAYNINKEDDCDNVLAQIIAESRVSWNIVHIIFAVLFFFIFIYSLHELLPFIMHKRFNPFEDQILLSMSSVFIISFINIILCITFVDYVSSNIQFLTFLLLSPQWFYFIIFSIVLYSWVLVSRSINKETDTAWYFNSKHLSKALQITTICLITLGVLEFIIVSSIRQSSSMLLVYSISQILWLSLLLLSAVIFTYFGYKTQSIVRMTALMISFVSSGSTNKQNEATNKLVDEHIQLSYKFLIATVTITSFFFIQCILIIYFLFINHYQNMLSFRIIDLLSHYICLLVICWLYKQTFDRLRVEYELKTLCNRECIQELLKKLKLKQKSLIERAASVSVTTTVIRARNVSHSSAANSTTDHTARPPSVQLSHKISDIAPLATINEILGNNNPLNEEPEPSLSLSLIQNEENQKVQERDEPETSLSISLNDNQEKQVVQQHHTVRSVPETRPSVFERKELLKLSTVKLAKICRQEHLSSKGSKADIVNRLLAASKPLPKMKPVSSRSFHE